MANLFQGLATHTANECKEWREATAKLCPVPDGVRPHFASGAAVGWDLQAIENVFCGICHKKTPQQIIDDARGSTSWVPNPCTEMEYRELYGEPQAHQEVHEALSKVKRAKRA